MQGQKQKQQETAEEERSKGWGARRKNRLNCKTGICSRTTAEPQPFAKDIAECGALTKSWKRFVILVSLNIATSTCMHSLSHMKLFSVFLLWFQPPEGDTHTPGRKGCAENGALSHLFPQASDNHFCACAPVPTKLFLSSENIHERLVTSQQVSQWLGDGGGIHGFVFNKLKPKPQQMWLLDLGDLYRV